MGGLSCLPVFRSKPKSGRIAMESDFSKSVNDVLAVRGIFTQGRGPQVLQKSYESEADNGILENCRLIGTFSLSHYDVHAHLYAALRRAKEVATSSSQTDSQGEWSINVSGQGGESFSGISGQSGERLSGDFSQSAESDCDNKIPNSSTIFVLDLSRKREYPQQCFLTSPNKCTSLLNDKESSVFLQFEAPEDMVETGKDGVQIKVDLFGKESFAFDVEADTLHTRVEQWLNQSDFIGSYCHKISDFAGSDDLEVVKPSCGAINHGVEHSFIENAVRSLHASSKMAHLSGVNLHETPSLRKFCLLRVVNLSSNLIVQISAGCLPRKLQSLNLSRNRITQIEGLKELTGLRILDLSHNRLTRIGHGLSNCIHLKELYLGGNKIIEVEGLHKLLELLVLDLHSNKLASTKSISQIGANCGSLRILNLLGNPIFSNVGEDHLRKFIGTLAPRLIYLNKRPVKVVPAQSGRLSDQVVKAAHRHFNKSKVSRRGVCSQLYGSRTFTHSHDRKASPVALSSGRSRHHHRDLGHGQYHHVGATVWKNDIM